MLAIGKQHYWKLGNCTVIEYRNSMGVAVKIWDKYHSCCIENGSFTWLRLVKFYPFTMQHIHCIYPTIPMSYHWYYSSFSLSLYNNSIKVYNHFRVKKMVREKNSCMPQKIGSRTQQLSTKKGHYWVPFHLGKMSQSQFSPNYTRTWS